MNKRMVQVTPNMLDDTLNDITYFLNDDGKVTHRTLYGGAEVHRESPYTVSPEHVNISGLYTYDELMKRKFYWS